MRLSCPLRGFRPRQSRRIRSDASTRALVKSRSHLLQISRDFLSICRALHGSRDHGKRRRKARHRHTRHVHKHRLAGFKACGARRKITTPRERDGGLLPRQWREASNRVDRSHSVSWPRPRLRTRRGAKCCRRRSCDLAENRNRDDRRLPCLLRTCPPASFGQSGRTPWTKKQRTTLPK